MEQPITLNAYMTSKCTAKCSFCTGRGQYKSASNLDVYPVVTAFSVFPTIMSVCIAGLGEPLLASTTPDVITTCLKEGRLVSLVTNGHLVLEAWDKIPWNALAYVSVFVNAIDPGLYRGRMGVDKFAAVEAGVQKLLEQGVNAGASFVVGMSVLDQVPGWLDWASKMGVHFVSIVNTLPRSGDKGFWKEVLSYSQINHVQRWRNHAQKLALEVNHWPVLVGRDPRDATAACRGPFETLGLDGDGNVSGCPRVQGPTRAWGNLFSDGADVYQSERFQILRNELRDGRLNPTCAKCFGAWA